MILKRSLATLAAVLLSTTIGITSASGNAAATTSTNEINGVIEGNATVFDAEQSELTVVPSTGPQPSDAELSALAATISCGLNVQNVHASTHVTGTINGVARIDCTGVAGKLTLHYSLIRVSPNPTQWGAPSVTNTGKSSIQTNRAVNCSQGPGSFRGWAQGVIVAPPGYTLVGPATSSSYGNITSVACGATLVAPWGSASESGETVDITFIRADLAS